MSPNDRMSHLVPLILLLAWVTAAGAPVSETAREAAQSPRPARNVILFIADGMQVANEIAAGRYLYGDDFALSWHQFPYRSYVATWDIDTYNRYARSLGAVAYSPGSFDPSVGYDPSRGGVAPWPIADIPDSAYIFNALPTWRGGAGTYAIPTTDSASAATALATGRKTDQGNVSWAAGDPPDGALTSICDLLKAEGASIGVVSTVEFSHATPAPFVAHNVSRGNPGQVAHEMVTQTKPDVVIGGGHPSWISGYISTADCNALRDSQEYILVERIAGGNGGEALLDAAERAAAEDRKLFGLFGGRLGCFDPAVPHDSPGQPGFDENQENPSLAQATLAALTVCATDPDGFFLMIEQGDLDWANHYNDYHWMIGAMWSLEEAVKTSIDFVDRPDDDIDWDNTMIIVTADHATGGLRLLRPGEPGIGDLPEMNGTRYHYSFPGGEVDYLCTQHTNELVPLYATCGGVELFRQHEGSWYAGTRIIDNTQVFEAIAEWVGVSDAAAR